MKIQSNKGRSIILNRIMEISRAKYLAEALINSKLSREDLDDLLSGMNDDEIVKVYSDVLENYFNDLLKRQNEDKC